MLGPTKGGVRSYLAIYHVVHLPFQNDTSASIRKVKSGTYTLENAYKLWSIIGGSHWARISKNGVVIK